MAPAPTMRMRLGISYYHRGHREQAFLLTRSSRGTAFSQRITCRALFKKLSFIVLLSLRDHP